MTDRTQMNAYGQIPIGIKNGEVVCVSDAAIAQWYPVKTSWSGHVVMVEANSHEEAIASGLLLLKLEKP